MLAHLEIESSGALLTFRGVVRPYEDERQLAGLHYTHYEPMATQQLQRLADRAAQTHALEHIKIIHSIGFVAANQASLHIAIASKHRKAALLGMDKVLDDLKREVPIWKTPVFVDDAEVAG
ncbi:MAG: molybdenum cofactor biosynthesis protein MoaE [Planctomycetota bacterium]